MMRALAHAAKTPYLQVYRGSIDMNTVEIRGAKPGDERILAHIQTESWRSAFAEILSPEELERSTDAEKAEEMYRNVLDRHFVHLLIEFVGKEPHCIAGWSANRSDMGAHVAELICIHSLPDRRHKGYGSVMMGRVLDEMKKAGYSEVILWVFEKNLNARRFYEKHGFAESNQKNQSHGAVELLYARRL